MTEPAPEAVLAGHVATWWQAIDDFTTLLEKLPEEDWSRPTDLPGWDVHAVAAHAAHLEAVLAGARHEEVDVGEPEHVRNPIGTFAEQGIAVRRDHTPDELINEIRAAATARHTALLADPPTDPDAPAPGLFGAIGWSTTTLLRNRPLDLWMHEQDIRRAVDRPGNLSSAPALHTSAYLAESLGMVVAKRAGAGSGTTVVLEIAGEAHRVVEVGDDGRARPVAEPEDPTVRICLDREAFTLLAGGRRAPEPGRVEVRGDTELGERILTQLAVTP